MSQAAGTEVDFLPFAKFLHKECPARVRGMLEGLYQVAWPAIAAALQRSFEQLEEDLFRHAERAPNVNEQNLSFDGQRELRRHRSDFIAACRDGVQRSLLHLIDAEVPRDQLRIGEPAAGRRTQLSLVDPVHLEQVLILSEVATRAEMRASDELNGLAYRLAVIVGSAPFELEAVALGPHALCSTLRVAAECFELSPPHLAALYRRIDKGLFADAAGLYQAINQHLVDQGILAWLQLTPRRIAPRSPSAARPPQPEAAGAGVAPASEVPAETSGPGSPLPSGFDPGVLPAPRPPSPQRDGMPAADSAAPMSSAPPPAAAAPPRPAASPVRAEGPAMQALRNYLKAEKPHRPAPVAEPAPSGAPAPASAPAAGSVASDAPDLLSFDTLRELLAGRRPVHADAAASDSEQRVAGEPDLDAALSALQMQAPVAPTQVGGRLVHRRVADVKRDILAQLRGRDGVQPRLSAPDSDAIDLVGFLFDHLLADQQPTSITHGLLTQLQVPLIKVALKDKAFFTQRNHPARQLLNSLMETAELWVEDESQDSAVVDKMRWVVDRVSRDYDSDAAVFGRLFEDLSRHMGGLKKKADVAERHNVEAARGKEKLELARIAAADHVKQRLDKADPPAAVRTLLESAWTDVIALAYLRQGYDHPQTHERLDFVDRLIELYGHGRPLPERRFEVQKLRSVFEDGLTSIGLHDDAVGKAWGDISRLVEEVGDASADAAASTVRELVERQPRLGEVRKEPGAAAAGARVAAEPTRTLLETLRKETALPLSPREAEMAERIKRLPFGTWFEFTTNQQGDMVRRKLCWFSPVTGNCLFVNVRGAKALDRTIDDLARDLVRGNVRLVDDKKENLIDRAWKGIVAMLRGAGLSGADAPAAAN
jgi:hypothetical protein